MIVDSGQLTTGAARGREWSEGAGLAERLKELNALAAQFTPPPRRKLYCASIQDFPIPSMRGAIPCMTSVIDVVERPWIATLDLEPGIYNLDGDFLVIGPGRKRETHEKRVARRGDGLTKLVYGKPNRMKRRAKGRKG